jgi:hypothetical protein
MEHSGDGFPDVVFEFINGLALRIATRKRRDLSPEATLSILVDDYRECLHA